MAGAFVVVALWLRTTAGAYHLYMFPPLAGGLSGNALLSIAVTGFGLLFVVRPANLGLKWLLPVYLLILLALLSASLNGDVVGGINVRSEAHTSELPSLMRLSYAVFCLKNTI